LYTKYVLVVGQAVSDYLVKTWYYLRDDGVIDEANDGEKWI